MNQPISNLIQDALAASNMTVGDLAQLDARLAEEAQDAYYSSPEYQAMSKRCKKRKPEATTSSPSPQKT